MPKTLKRRPPARGFTPATQAAGKSISSKNEKKLASALEGIANAAKAIQDILGEAGLLDGDGEDEGDTQAGIRSDNASGTPAAPEGQAEETQAATLEDTQVEASEFTNFVDRSNWYQRLDNILWSFSWFFQDAVDDLAEGEGSQEINQLIQDLQMYLQELATSYPAISASVAQLAAAKPGHEADDMYSLPCSLDLIEAAAGNRLPIEGKLFTVDQLSEGVPAKGPGKKLYIPRAVAEEAVNQCVGLPLDAADTLDHHANEEIVGVMLGATLRQDNGFWVRGSLFPFNQPEKVAQIRANKASLGFSINAYAPGHDEEVNGEMAHVVDKLILLGANILYKQSATFQQTELVASSQTPDEQDTPQQEEEHRGSGRLKLGTRLRPSEEFNRVVSQLIAASAEATNAEQAEQQPEASAVSAEGDRSITPEPTQETTGETEMNEEIKAALDAQNQLITQLSELVTPLVSSVTILVDERNQRIQQEEQEKVAAQTAQQQKEMQAMIRQTAKETLANLLNPTGVPARISSGVVAASTTKSVDPESIDGQILQLEARLQEIQRSTDPTMMARRVQLRDEIHKLRMQQIPEMV